MTLKYPSALSFLRSKLSCPTLTLKPPLTRSHSKVDGTQSYIRWAVSHGFGVIDINIPEYVTINDPSEPEYHDTEHEYASITTDIARKEGEKLTTYIWENYVEPYKFPGGIFLMGAGTAFHALAKLVSDNGKSTPVGVVDLQSSVYMKGCI